MTGLRAKLHELYHGHSPPAIRFQIIWLIFDFLLIVFFMVSPFVEKGTAFLIVDYVIALVLFLASDHSDHITGRFIHAKDSYREFLPGLPPDSYTLRRVQP